MLLSKLNKYTTTVLFGVGRLVSYNNCMPKFYTKSGDDGYSGRLGEGRIPKNHPVMEAVGAIDEASAVLGIARAQSQTNSTNDLLLNVQRDLYHLMAEVSATPENAAKFRLIDEGKIRWLEEMTDTIGSSITMPNEFIVPGDSLGGASFALSRAVVRRAERRVADLHLAGVIENENLLRYLNRLSSLCFVLELRENQLSDSLTQTLAKPED
jgi:cob(I)alamin adenosyltransferase